MNKKFPRCEIMLKTVTSRRGGARRKQGQDADRPISAKDRQGERVLMSQLPLTCIGRANRGGGLHVPPKNVQVEDRHKTGASRDSGEASGPPEAFHRV